MRKTLECTDWIPRWWLLWRGINRPSTTWSPLPPSNHTLKKFTPSERVSLGTYRSCVTSWPVATMPWRRYPKKVHVFNPYIAPLTKQKYLGNNKYIHAKCLRVLPFLFLIGLFYFWSVCFYFWSVYFYFWSVSVSDMISGIKTRKAEDNVLTSSAFQIHKISEIHRYK